MIDQLIVVTHSGAVEFWTGCMAPGGCGASWFIVGEEDMTTAMVAARVARAREKKRSGRDSARPHRTPPHTTAFALLVRQHLFLYCRFNGAVV